MKPKYDHLDLPESPTTEGLVMLIGQEALAQLSLDFGGSMVSIPQKAGPNSPLVFSIGREAAQKLCDIWGGMSFTVPLTAGKKTRILRLLDEKKPVNLICRLVGVSRSQVYRIIDAEASKNQLDMF